MSYVLRTDVLRNGLISLLNNFIIPIRTAKIARIFECSDGRWLIIIDLITGR